MNKKSTLRSVANDYLTHPKENGGITLIALVVTIIVLLILAGISIQMLTGDNGILTRAGEAKETTRGGEVKETVALEATNNAGVDYIGETKKSRTQVIDELHAQGKLTDEEVAQLEENDVITIGGITTDFSVLGSISSNLTLGEVYDSGDLKIGDKLTYSSKGQSNWIVFGKDTSGNILITTERPIDNGFYLNGGAESWLKYESYTDETYGLNYACSGYGETVQETQVYSRSINMEDINYVAGLTPKTVTADGNTYHIQSFDTYTFGTTSYNETNRTANYWYPILEGGTGANGNGTGFWKQPTAVDEKTFENNWYDYHYNNGYYYYGADTNGNYVDATSVGLNTDNLQYIWGGNTNETRYNSYLVASRYVRVNSDGAGFSVSFVGFSGVGAGVCLVCASYSSNANDLNGAGSFGVRPVVVLPSSLLVEEQTGGTYDVVNGDVLK